MISRSPPLKGQVKLSTDSSSKGNQGILRGEVLSEIIMVIGLSDFLVWLQNYGQSLVWDLVFFFFFSFDSGN